MAVMATIPVGRPLTIEDLEAIRDGADDGRRYELVDGSLVVTPSPTRVHQRCMGRLFSLLVAQNPEPARMEVLVAHLDIGLKWSRYAAAGIPQHWVVDPDEPGVTAWVLDDGVHVEAARGSGEQQVTLPGPWPVRLSPAALVRR